MFRNCKMILLKKWDSSKVAEMIDEFMRKNNDIKTIITFDGNGVTKHPNHISCFDGLMYYLNKYSDECKNKNIQVFILESFNFVLQYTWIIPMIKCFLVNMDILVIHFLLLIN